MPITDIDRIKKFSQKCGATLPGHIVQRLEKAGASAVQAKKGRHRKLRHNCRAICVSSFDGV